MVLGLTTYFLIGIIVAVFAAKKEVYCNAEETGVCAFFFWPAFVIGWFLKEK